MLFESWDDKEEGGPDACIYPLIKIVVIFANEHGMRRYGTDIYKRHKAIPSFFERYGDAWECISQLVANVKGFHSVTVTKKKIMDWFTDKPHSDFPIIQKFSIAHIGFRNGVFDIESGEFELGSIPVNIAVGIKVDDDYELGYETRPCPTFDKILGAQMTPDVYYWLEVQFGRVFFVPKTREDWQIFTYMYGLGGAGKGVLLTLLVSFLPEEQHGVLAATQEPVFGRANLIGRRLNIGMECPENLDDMLKKGDLFSMAANETMNSARKNQTAKFGAWMAYIFLASNYKISYLDTSGAYDDVQSLSHS